MFLWNFTSKLHLKQEHAYGIFVFPQMTLSPEPFQVFHHLDFMIHNHRLRRMSPRRQGISVRSVFSVDWILVIFMPFVVTATILSPWHLLMPLYSLDFTIKKSILFLMFMLFSFMIILCDNMFLTCHCNNWDYLSRKHFFF